MVRCESVMCVSVGKKSFCGGGVQEEIVSLSFLLKKTQNLKGVEPGMATFTIILNDLLGKCLLPTFQLLTSNSLEVLVCKGRMYLLEDTMMILWHLKLRLYLTIWGSSRTNRALL